MVRCGPDVEQALDHTVCRPYSIPNPAVAGCNSDLAQYSNTPSHTFRARAQLVRGSQRSIMNAAQGRPRDLSSVATTLDPDTPLNVGLASEARSTGGALGEGGSEARSTTGLRRKHEDDFDAPGEAYRFVRTQGIPFRPGILTGRSLPFAQW